MPRAIWSGVISFGLVNVPVRLVTAVRDRSIHFNMLTPDGTCRLRQKLYCPETGKEYDFKQAARGYEIAPDQYVIIDKDELDRLKPEKGRTIEIAAFVDLDQIDPIYFDRTYYLVPDQTSAKAYKLLVQAMAESGKVALARFVMREREQLATLRARDGVIVLHTMFYHDEIGPIDSLDGIERAGKTPVREVKVAEQLIAALTDRFEPEKYRDEFREKLEKAIQAKAEGEEIVTAASEEPEPPPVYNLMEALKRSLAQTEGKSAAPRRRQRAQAAAPRRRKSA
jgi:DNA end-binding protein Ku